MAHKGDKYFSVDGGLSYKKLLKHFQDQAKGSRNISLINDYNSIRGTAAGFRRPRFHGSLVLVDMGDSGENLNKRGENIPKVEVVDPTEGDRRRAEAQVAEENRRIAQQVSNNGYSTGKSQTHNGSRKGKSSKRKAAGSSSSAAKLAIKRAKDIFED